jgi:hypothetical protein
MSEGKKAAIDIDELGNKTLSEVTAAEFLTALSAGGLTLKELVVWPEWKKIALLLEPEDLGKISLKDIIIRIQVEKKKHELEKIPGVENWRDPQGSFYEDLLNRLTQDIEARLRTSR